MPTQKIASIPERVIPAQEVVLNSFEIGIDGHARLYFASFHSDIQLSEDQQDRILAIVLESAETAETLKDATIEDRVIEEVAPSEEVPA